MPETARALALVVSDPDASGGTYRHWVVVDVDPDALSTPAGGAPEGGRTLENSAGHPAYDGPCPPSGRHRLPVHRLRAPCGHRTAAGHLGVQGDGRLIEARAIARGVLGGTYEAGEGRVRARPSQEDAIEAAGRPSR